MPYLVDTKLISRAEDERHAFASWLAFFHGCPAVIGRLLRKGGSNLLVAKLLVICRLLYKVLSQHEQKSAIVDRVRDRLASLRGKLLRRIDSMFCNERPPGSVILENMCAFLLATSSTPIDVLKHFLHVRLEAVKGLLGREDDELNRIGSALRLYLQTVQDSRTLMVNRLATALLSLRSRPLIKDDQLGSLLEYDFDLNISMLPEEIRNFTPWLRHDLLQKTAVDSIVESWTKATFEAFLQGVEEALQTVADAPCLMQLRRDVMRIWSSPTDMGTRRPAVTHLMRLRMAIVARLKQVIWSRTMHLEDVGREICKIVQDSKEEHLVPRNGLWAASQALIDIGFGGARLKSLVHDRLHGSSVQHRRAMQKYSDWRICTEDLDSIIKQLKTQTWDEELDLEMDENDATTGIQQPEDGAAAIEEHFSKAINTAFSCFQGLLAGTVTHIASRQQVARACCAIRILRDVRQQLPQYGGLDSFGLSLVPKLHQVLAESVSKKALERLEEGVAKEQRSISDPVFELWEGSPPLPTQPTPMVFAFLYSVVSAMAEMGSDLWTAAATRRVREYLQARVPAIFDRSVEPAAIEHENTEESENMAAVEPIPDDRRREIQRVFDLMLLQEALRVSSDKSHEQMDEVLEKALMDVDKHLSSSDRLGQNVQDYWKRTSQLFSLMAS